MSDKGITKDDIQEQQETEFKGLDFFGIAEHCAKHTARELARLMDVKRHIERKDIVDAYKTENVTLDGLGNGTIVVKDTTRSILIQKQGGHLDGLQIQIGEQFSFTYPANTISFDTIHLFTFSTNLYLKGTAGDNYIVVQTPIENYNLSSILQG